MQLYGNNSEYKEYLYEVEDDVTHGNGTRFDDDNGLNIDGYILMIYWKANAKMVGVF